MKAKKENTKESFIALGISAIGVAIGTAMIVKGITPNQMEALDQGFLVTAGVGFGLSSAIAVAVNSYNIVNNLVDEYYESKKAKKLKM
jgi:hypothetical protein